MSIEFYHHIVSPPSRMVRMTMEELGIGYTEHVIDILKGEHKTPEFTAINPRIKVPAIRDGSLTMGESRAIACYLCNKYGASKNKRDLYPEDPAARAKVDQILYIDVDWWERVEEYANIFGVFLRGEKTKVELVQPIHDLLGAIEKFLDGKKYIAADHLTLADLSVYNTLADLEITDFNEYDSYPNLMVWKNTIMQLPYYEKTCSEGMKVLRDLYQSKLKGSS